MERLESNPLKEITFEIERLFDFFNEKFYHSILIRPVISIHLGKVGKRTAESWLSTVSWKKENETINELNFVAELLQRRTKKNIPEIVCALLHEMVHLSNHQNNIQDVADNGAHHSKTFAILAKAKGLMIEIKDTYPRVITPDLSYEGLIYYHEFNFNESLLKLFETFSTEERTENEISKETKHKKPKLKNLVCPGCNIKAYVAYGLKTPILCGECNKLLLEK